MFALRLAKSLTNGSLGNQATTPPPGRGWDHTPNAHFFFLPQKLANSAQRQKRNTVSVRKTRQRSDATYWGAAVGQGGHADGRAHLVAGRGGEGGRRGAPLLHFLPLEEVAPRPLDATRGRRHRKYDSKFDACLNLRGKTNSG